MQLWKNSLLAGVLAAAAFAQTASDFEAPQVNRVAQKLNCNCGCNMNMACLMPPYPCPVCRAAKAKIISMQAAGKSDTEILDQFAKGDKNIVAVGPGLLGVVGPYAALALGLGIVVWLIRRMRSGPAPVAAPEIDAATIERIEKDLSKLD